MAHIISFLIPFEAGGKIPGCSKVFFLLALYFTCMTLCAIICPALVLRNFAVGKSALKKIQLGFTISVYESLCFISSIEIVKASSYFFVRDFYYCHLVRN